MPLWGRPSGARKGMKEKGRNRKTRQWEESRRFEEIDSDGDDEQGVVLDSSFMGDELYFTGADLGSRPQIRRSHGYDELFGSSEEEQGLDDDSSGGTVQVALRDKQDLLVQKALERIRRAQQLGRTDVELTQPEIDALTRKRRKDEAARKAGVRSSEVAKRRQSSGQLKEALRDQRSSNRRIKTPISHFGGPPPSPKQTTPPGIVILGPDGNPSYQAFEHYPTIAVEPYSRPSRSGSQSASSHSQLKSTPPLTSSQFRPPKARYFSVPEATRPSSMYPTNPQSHRLPDDPNWHPRPRSASSTPSYAARTVQDQTYLPSLPYKHSQHAQARRNVSRPPESQYIRSRKKNPQPMHFAATSEPSLHLERPSQRLQEYSRSSDDADDDNGDYGVEVDVGPYGQSYGVKIRPEEFASGRIKRDDQ